MANADFALTRLKAEFSQAALHFGPLHHALSFIDIGFWEGPDDPDDTEDHGDPNEPYAVLLAATGRREELVRSAVAGKETVVEDHVVDLLSGKYSVDSFFFGTVPDASKAYVTFRALASEAWRLALMRFRMRNGRTEIPTLFGPPHCWLELINHYVDSTGDPVVSAATYQPHLSSDGSHIELDDRLRHSIPDITVPGQLHPEVHYSGRQIVRALGQVKCVVTLLEQDVFRASEYLVERILSGTYTGPQANDDDAGMPRKDVGTAFPGELCLPPREFLRRWGISDDALRQAKHRGKLRYKPMGRTHNLYSVESAKGLWPQKFAGKP